MPINESQLNKALESQTAEIKKTVKESQDYFNIVAKSLTESMQKMVDKLNLLTERVDAQDIHIRETQISLLETKTTILETKVEVVSQKSSTNALEKKLETLEIRARSKNLIVHGVEEKENETRPSLQREIRELLNKHYGLANASIELPSRLPTKDNSTGRPLLVSFLLKSDRDSILYRTKPQGCPIVVKADLPPATAAKRRILGQLTRWAKDNPDKVKKWKRTDHFVELDGTRYNHEEAKDFIAAFADKRSSHHGKSKESPMMH